MLYLNLFSALFLALSPLGAQSPRVQASPLGIWRTTDDQTGEVKSHIQIFELNGRQYGKIIRVMRPSLNHRCDNCEGERKDQPILGMVIIEDMVYADGFWQGGRVLFPKQGKWYKLQYWLAPDNTDRLVVRGYMGPFFRTQFWERVN